VTAPAKGDSCTAGDLVTDTTVKLCIDGNVDHLVPLSINTDNEYFIQASLLNTKLASDKYYVITIGENIVEPKTLTNDDKKYQYTSNDGIPTLLVKGSFASENDCVAATSNEFVMDESGNTYTKSTNSQ